MTHRKCKGLCVMEWFKREFDTTRGLPPTIKNRLEKKKCRLCEIWMRIESWNCFCCNQQLTMRRARSPKTLNKWHHNYPTFAALKMMPIQMERVLNKV